MSAWRQVAFQKASWTTTTPGFCQASTKRFYDRPGLTFIPVDGLPPSALAIAWRNDMDAPPVNDFVETARMLAALDLVPGALTPPMVFPTAPPALSVVGL